MTSIFLTIFLSVRSGGLFFRSFIARARSPIHQVSPVFRETAHTPISAASRGSVRELSLSFVCVEAISSRRLPVHAPSSFSRVGMSFRESCTRVRDHCGPPTSHLLRNVPFETLARRTRDRIEMIFFLFFFFLGNNRERETEQSSGRDDRGRRFEERRGEIVGRKRDGSTISICEDGVNWPCLERNEVTAWAAHC